MSDLFPSSPPPPFYVFVCFVVVGGVGGDGGVCLYVLVSVFLCFVFVTPPQ